MLWIGSQATTVTITTAAVVHSIASMCPPTTLEHNKSSDRTQTNDVQSTDIEREMRNSKRKTARTAQCTVHIDRFICAIVLHITAASLSLLIAHLASAASHQVFLFDLRCLCIQRNLNVSNEPDRETSFDFINERVTELHRIKEKWHAIRLKANETNKTKSSKSRLWTMRRVILLRIFRIIRRWYFGAPTHPHYFPVGDFCCRCLRRLSSTSPHLFLARSCGLYRVAKR